MTTRSTKHLSLSNSVGVNIRFTPLQLQGLRRVVRKGDPEVFAIKADNLGVGNLVFISSDEEGKVQRALDNKTGVKITFDADIQTKPVLDWIKSTLHSKSASRTSKKTRKTTTTPLETVVEEEVVEEPVQVGNGGVLPYQPRGRGFMTRELMRRRRVAPSLQQWRSAHTSTVNGRGIGAQLRNVTRATHRGVVRASNKLQRVMSHLRKK